MSLPHRLQRLQHLQRLKPRHKFAALGVVAVAMVATPLVQVLRYQSAELEAVLYEQAGLDPVSGAVALQWSLLAHRDIAGMVLHGVLDLEPEREVRQIEVDNRLVALQSALIELKRARAIDEALAMQQDWTSLVPLVQQRRIKAAESDAAHRLLLEQALQVVDLLASASGLEPSGTHTTYMASVRELSALPHLALQLAALRPPAGAAPAAVPEREIAAAEAALARAIGHLNEGLARGALADPPLAAAAAVAGATADHLFHLRRHPQAAPPPVLAAATAAALRAQVRLFDAAHATVSQTLAARKERIEGDRALLVALLLVLAGTAALLSLQLRREWQALAAAADKGPADGGSDDNADGQAPRRAVAGRLWQRLRQGASAAPAQTVEPAAAPKKTALKETPGTGGAQDA